MRTPSTIVSSIVALTIAACSADGPSAEDLNKTVGGDINTAVTATGDNASATSTVGGVTSGADVTTGTTSTTGVGASGGTLGPTTATVSGSGGATNTSGGIGMTATATSMGGSDGMMTTSGTMTSSTSTSVGGASTATESSSTTGSGGGTACAETDPYCPRSGPFKMLAYSRTTGFRHDSSIATGKVMLQDIADEQGFDLTITEENSLFTTEGLAQFEVIFFMNTTGDILNNNEQQIFEAWMKNNGAFCGTHSATDTEAGWDFYKEVTGQYYDGHSLANTAGAIVFEASAMDSPILKGLPNPWQRNEEWYNFNSFQQWSSKPGFQILGRKQADNQPIMWVREYDNFRSFYTAIGHDGVVFQDPEVKKLITAGILWSVRREAQLP